MLSRIEGVRGVLSEGHVGESWVSSLECIRDPYFKHFCKMESLRL